MKKIGMVYLVGAGPGDPGLITVKGMEALRTAECVIYDFLASPLLLNDVTGEKIYVGKQGGDHTMSQDEINGLIIGRALEGKTVVRLKGGDPFIFGRGGEEAEELVKHGVPFRIIPGISSFYSAPAYAGIPVTHRDYANAFEVITGHRRADSPEEEVNLPEYNPLKTFAFLMGMKNISAITGELIHKKGFPPSTPAAVITWGTTPRQRVVAADLAGLPSAVEQARLIPPAIILVGGVVKLRESLRWFDVLPLFGRRIVVTRTREQASVLSAKLSHLGAEVVELPTIVIKPVADMAPLHASMNRLPGYGWILFTSQNAVHIFFKELYGLGKDARGLSPCRVGAIGSATARELERYGVVADLVPREFVAEALVDELGRRGVSGVRVLLPCASEARLTLPEGLAALGATVDRIPIYDTVPPDPPEGELRELVRSADIVTFTSSSTARNFFSIFDGTPALCASIGPVTSKSVREAGAEAAIEAKEYTIDGLVKAIVSHYGG